MFHYKHHLSNRDNHNLLMIIKLTKNFKIITNKWTNRYQDQLTISERTIQQKTQNETDKLQQKTIVKIKILMDGKIHQQMRYPRLLYKPKVSNFLRGQDHQLDLHHMVFLLLKIHNSWVKVKAVVNRDLEHQSDNLIPTTFTVNESLKTNSKNQWPTKVLKLLTNSILKVVLFKQVRDTTLIEM